MRTVTAAVTGLSGDPGADIADVELAPFLASRVWVNFRHVDGPAYLERVGALVDALLKLLE